MSDDLDLDSFIAGIEQSAPKTSADAASDRLCPECKVKFEIVDDEHVCPVCGAQATNILQLEQSEMMYDESGKAMYGQRILTQKTRTAYETDYGWAWSTDEAIVEILRAQVKALEDLKLVSDEFRHAVRNMWMRFWTQDIAPYIRDEYEESQMIPVDIAKALRYRDIEVLVKVRDKVMVPRRKRQKNARKKYTTLNRQFKRAMFLNDDLNERGSDYIVDSDSSCSDQEQGDTTLRETTNNAAQENGRSSEDTLHEVDDNRMTPLENTPRPRKARSISLDTVTILTLNRTLAFLEGAARCLQMPTPLLATDIVRLCNQGLIPFYGAHKLLPDHMKLDDRDRLTFQNIRPPAPHQLSRATSLLLCRIYKDKLPFHIPEPDVEQITLRFLEDLNLPSELWEHVEQWLETLQEYKFLDSQRITGRHDRTVQLHQHDRRAFAILLSVMKHLFILDDESLRDIREQCRLSEEDALDFMSWTSQLKLRLNLAFRFDPYILLHPMCDITLLESSEQLYKYISGIMDSRPIATARQSMIHTCFDENYRQEMCEFMAKSLPRPDDIPAAEAARRLKKPSDLRHPLSDAVDRTSKLWQSHVAEQDNPSEILDELHCDYKSKKLVFPLHYRRWSVMDGQLSVTQQEPQMCDYWSECFRLILKAGCYLCYCQPRDILHEMRSVEEIMYPELKVRRRQLIRLTKL